MAENNPNMSFGPLDITLFTLVLVATAGAGIFQGWFEAFSSQHGQNTGGLALPRNKGPIFDFLAMVIFTCSVPIVVGIPTHVYQFGASVLAAMPAIILAQASALLTVAPVFGKAKKDILIDSNSAAAMELMNSTKIPAHNGQSNYLNVTSYIQRRFRSTSLNVLLTVLIFALWFLLSAFILYAISGILERISPFGTNGSIACTLLVASAFTALEGKSRLLWTDLALSLILIGGVLTIFISGSVDSGGSTAVLEMAKQIRHFQRDSFSIVPTAQDSYISTFFGHFFIWFAIYAGFYSSDGRTRSSSNICVAILHTPFLLLLLAIVVMIGLVLVITPKHTKPCAQANFGRDVIWPDQRLPDFVLQWLVKHHGLSGFAGLFLSALTAHSFSLISSGFNNLFFKAWDKFRMYDSTCLTSSKGAERQIFVRILASVSTMLSGCMVFAVAGMSTDIYELLFKSTGILIGTLVAIYVIGLFVPFAKSGKALVFASMITLGFGHWMSIGSIVHFTHQPIYSGNNIAYNCSGGTVVPHLPYPSNQQNNIDKSSFTSNMNPFGSSSSSKEKGEYPPHIPVVKSKTSRAFKDVQGNGNLPRAPVSNWIDPRDRLATIFDARKSSSSSSSHVNSPDLPRSLAFESGFSTPASDVNSQEEKSVIHVPRAPNAPTGNSKSGQTNSGNKPPLISGSPIYGGNSEDDEHFDHHGGLKKHNHQRIHVENISAFYRISCHLYGLIGFLSTFIFGTLISLVVSQVSKSSENGSADSTQDVDPDKPRSMGNVTVDPYLLHPIVNTLLCGCYNGDSRHEEEPKDYNGTMYERRKSQMMASIEDSMAELADPSMDPTQLLGGGGGYNHSERRASRISRRSHRSSLGGRGSINGSEQGLTTTTTTAEVLASPNPTSIEQVVMERRMSQISGNDLAAFLQQTQLGRTKSDFGAGDHRSPRSGPGPGSVRRTSVMAAGSPHQVVNVPMPTLSTKRIHHNSLSPKSSILLAPPTSVNVLEQQQQQFQNQQRRFSEMPAVPVDQRRFSDIPVDRNGSQADRLNSRQKSKRSQSVMYRQGRPPGGAPRRSSKSASRHESIAEHADLMHRRRSVRM